MITDAHSSISNTMPSRNGYEFKGSSISSKLDDFVISPIKAKSIKNQKIPPRFEIEFPDFDYKFSFKIIKTESELSASEIIFYLKLDENVIKVVFSGDRVKREGLYVNNLGFGDELQGQTPVSVFRLKSLWAMMSLSEEIKIRIPSFNQEDTISFDTNLNKISELLQFRQIAYRLLVIEKTFGIRLPFPQFIDSKNVMNIAYCYHSITDRKFKWFYPPAIVSWFASKKYLSLLPKENISFPIQEENESVKINIFGYQINLRSQIRRIEDGVLENFEDVKKGLSKLDGNEVLAQIRSKSGVIQIESVTTPHLPKNAFSKRIQKLIDLKESFDSLYFNKYLNSFSDAFEDLTDEQIQAITEHPELEEEAFNF